MKCSPGTAWSSTFLLLLLLASAGFIAPAWCEPTPDQQQYESFTEAPYFSCSIPADWHKESNPFGLSPEEKKVFGITLIGPDSGPVPTRISVHYYAEGNLLHSSMEVYIKRHSEPIFTLKEGDSFSPLEEVMIAGKKAFRFERQKNEFIPSAPPLGDEPPKEGVIYERREMMARPVEVKERFVVVSAGAGFYALRYSAAADEFQNHLPCFEQVVATLQMQH